MTGGKSGARCRFPRSAGRANAHSTDGIAGLQRPPSARAVEARCASSSLEGGVDVRRQRRAHPRRQRHAARRRAGHPMLTSATADPIGGQQPGQRVQEQRCEIRRAPAPPRTRADRPAPPKPTNAHSRAGRRRAPPTPAAIACAMAGVRDLGEAGGQLARRSMEIPAVGAGSRASRSAMPRRSTGSRSTGNGKTIGLQAGPRKRLMSVRASSRALQTHRRRRAARSRAGPGSAPALSGPTTRPMPSKRHSDPPPAATVWMRSIGELHAHAPHLGLEARAPPRRRR